MPIKTITIFLFISALLHSRVQAQRLKIQSYGIGYRVFEVDAVGNNPTTIAPLLKDPGTYLNYLNSITSNSLYGNPEVLHLHTFYVNIQWHQENSVSRFWKKHTLETGLLITSRITQQAGGIGNETFSDPVSRRYIYALTKKQQFLGAHAGVNRNFSISRKLQFSIGFHAQGSVAVVHRYEPSWDSSTYSPSTGQVTSITHLPNLAGKNFFQWQLMIPLGLEYALYKQTLFVRLEADAGIVGGRYRPRFRSLEEAHGAGIWFVFIPNKVLKNNRAQRLR